MISIRETGRSTLKMKYHIAKYNEIGIVSSANCQKILRPYMEYFKQKMLSVEAYCILTL
jgi:hypothetical protein